MTPRYVRPATASTASTMAAGPRLAPPRRLHAVVVPLLLAAVTTAAAPGVIRLQRGDTLSALAQRYGTTVAELQRINGLTSSRIYAGQLLTLPGSSGATSAGRTGGYTVRRGDTLIDIARRHNVSVAALRSANGLRADLIYGGQVLVVPGAGRTSGAGSGRYPVTTSRTAGDLRAQAARRATPSKTAMKSIIERTARRYGVSPSLALAVAHQESGFQMNVVSPAAAVGAMQVLPSTGAWVSRSLAGRPLDLLDPQDNATAGVLLLKSLTGVADTETAVAGYFQGLASVRSRGQLPETRTYVSNVLALRERYR